MKYYSTNHKSPKVGFIEALMNGLAPDGGLYFPEEIPTFSNEELKNLPSLSIQELGALILKKWIGNDISEPVLDSVSHDALNFPLPIINIGENKVMELFHGPTLAFKDIAARTLAHLINAYLERENKTATVLVATSGDTGGAVAHGFANLERIKVVVLFPKDKISSLQEEQLTRVAPNVTSIEVDGVFDDCQAMVKKAFVDNDLQKLNLTSANSINIGRLVPQILFYVYGYSKFPTDDLIFVVPSGNFGNITAGLFAQAMGIPIKQFVIANNSNDAVYNYYKTGNFTPKETIQTLSNAMDVGNPSNIVRILELLKNDHALFTHKMSVSRVLDEEVRQTIKNVKNSFNYLLDPHTAVAWHAAERFSDIAGQKIILSTASPLKFSDVIHQITGESIDTSEAIAPIKHYKKRFSSIKNDYSALKNLLMNLNE